MPKGAVLLVADARVLSNWVQANEENDHYSQFVYLCVCRLSVQHKCSLLSHFVNIDGHRSEDWTADAKQFQCADVLMALAVVVYIVIVIVLFIIDGNSGGCYV